jgi:hypothetical protein
MGPHHDVDMVGTPLNVFGIHLRETACHCDLHAGFLPLERSDVAQIAKKLISGVLSNAAGIKDDDIGIFEDL